MNCAVIFTSSVAAPFVPWMPVVASNDLIVQGPEVAILPAMTSAANRAAAITSQLVRGRASLGTATDAGDIDPYDPTNASATPVPGFLFIVRIGPNSAYVTVNVDGSVMDGLHRVARALLEGRETLPAVRFVTMPPPQASCNTAACPNLKNA